MEFNGMMLDIETVGTRPGCNILTIGAIKFSLAGVSEAVEDRFYRRINHQELDNKFSYDVDTMKWWTNQNSIVREEAFGGLANPYHTIEDFIVFCRRDKNLQVFANHANFDFPILEHYIRQLGYEIPWHYRNINCYATLKNNMKFIPRSDTQIGVAHNALDDAINQANHCVKLLQFLN